jgi:hypothetical protein
MVIIGNESVGGNTTVTGNISANNATLTTNLTLSGGTANGVGYLNGSKVLTTGTAFVFDGTNVGIGAASPSYKLDVLSATTFVSRFQNGSNQPVFAVSASGLSGIVSESGSQNGWLMTSASNYVTAYTSGAERMRIDSSGNVGIGTSSPRAGYNLTLGAGGTGATNGTLNLDGSNASSQGAGIRFARNSVGTCYIGSASWLVGGTSTDLVFSANTNATEAMRIDSSGNLGLGVTPSAWYASSKALQVSIGTSIEGRTAVYSYSSLGANTYTNSAGTYTYIGTDYASRYLQLSGQHQWYNAPSGTAGNTITFTQAMTLNNSNQLSIGTANANGILTAWGSAVTSNGQKLVGQFYNNATSSTSATINIQDNASSTGVGIGSAGDNLIFYTATSGLTEKARIDSGGNTYIETGLLWQYAPTPTTKAAAATLTAAELATDIITLTGTTYTVTLPTGTAIDTYYTGVPATNIGYDFHIINTASGTITMAVGASGMTSVGTLTITTGLSAHFRLRRTAANTYVLYRLS